MPEDVPEFDAPVFKRLAQNDTGSAKGHQGGFLVPRALEQYFPAIPAASPAVPAPGKRVDAILVTNTGALTVETRYQRQTWKYTRLPGEARLTGNLGFVLNPAAKGDFLIIERGLENTDLFRITLVQAGTPEFAILVSQVGMQRSGLLNPTARPVRDTDITTAEQQQQQHELKPLALFDNTAVATETRVQKIARGKAFQKKVMSIYDNKCAVRGRGFMHPVRGFEVEAAHIVPRGKKGADDARNGLALCRAHHWAFDHGLFGINAPNVIYVPSAVKAMSVNADLAALHGKKLRAPSDLKLTPSDDAFKWHREYTMK
jgi:putative restriction endonuclease